MLCIRGLESELLLRNDSIHMGKNEKKYFIHLLYYSIVISRKALIFINMGTIYGRLLAIFEITSIARKIG